MAIPAAWPTNIALLVVLAAHAASQQARVNAKDGLTYVWIPAGTYKIGCTDGPRLGYDWEAKPKSVRVAGFWIGQTEVTQAAFERVTGSNPSLYQGTQRPVDQESWNQARLYCESVGMRLPTELE